jgi:hypothetical protein
MVRVRVRVIFYIISWVHQFNYSIYTLCLGLGLGLGLYFTSLAECVLLVWEGFRSREKCGRLHFFPFLLQIQMVTLANYQLWLPVCSFLSACQPCRPVYRVDLVNLSTCKNLSTMSTCLPCRSVYLVNLSTCQLVILSTLQPIYQFNIHNIIHYIGRINIKWIFKVKSPRTSFYRILDLSHISDDRYWLHR